MTRGRIIDGEVYDARAEADRVRAEAAQVRAEAERVRDEAQAELARARVEASAVRANAGLDGDPAARAAQLDAGHVTGVVGLVITAQVPGLALGDLVQIDRRRGGPLPAEVVGFRGDEALLLPLGELTDLSPRATVLRTGGPLTIRAGDALRGRVLDGLGRPIDGGPKFDERSESGGVGATPASPVGMGRSPLGNDGLEVWAVDRPAPSPLDRPRIRDPLATGVRAIDGFLTLGEGQRLGLFAGSGVGKSTLLAQIARTSSADVTVVCLVGERGKELREFVDEGLGAGRDRAVVVCATSDAPSLVRLRAVHVATAIAEWFRDRRGARVLLVVDSLTRVARAQREVGLSIGEPPARQGYPPSVFALLPRLVERAGRAASGSITAVYTVLVAGSDMDEPIADEVRGIVDGHVVLDRRLAARGHFPPIDVLASVSRAMPHVTTDAHRAAAAAARRRLAIYEDHRDLVTLGAYKPGTDRALDDAIAHQPALDAFLRQPSAEATPFADTLAALDKVAR